MLVSDVQFSKALLPMLLTLLGITYDVAFSCLNAINTSFSLPKSTPSSYVKYGDLLINSPFHSINGFPNIFLTDEGIVMLISELHQQKALSPMLVTLSGIVILTNEKQPLNALSPIPVTSSGITYEAVSRRLNAIILSLFLLSNTPSSYVKYGDLLINSPYHSWNGFPCIFFTETGIVILLNDVKPKASSPMIVTLFGIVMLLNNIHAPKALLPICFTLSGIVMLLNEESSKALLQITFVPGFIT